MAATAKTSKQVIQQKLPTQNSQSSDTIFSEQVRIQYTQDFFEKMIDTVGNLAQITSNMLRENASDTDDNDENCNPRDVVKDDTSAQQQRFKQSYPKLRREAKF